MMTNTQTPNQTPTLSPRERAQLAKTALRDAVLAAVPEGLVARPGNCDSHTLYVSTTATDTSAGDLASVAFEVTYRSYLQVVQVTVKPDYRLRYYGPKAKTVSFWADHKKDFVVDPAKVVARLQALLVQMQKAQANEAELDKWRKADEAKKAEVTARVVAVMQDVKVGWTSDTKVRDWNGTSNGVFDVRLHNLTEAEMLAVLAVVAPKQD